MPPASHLRRSISFKNFKSIAGLWTGLALAGLLPGTPAHAQGTLQELFQEAQTAKAGGDLLTAERKYLELIRRSPDMANAYHNLGIVYLAEHKYGDASQVLDKAVKLS